MNRGNIYRTWKWFIWNSLCCMYSAFLQVALPFNGALNTAGSSHICGDSMRFRESDLGYISLQWRTWNWWLFLKSLVNDLLIILTTKKLVNSIRSGFRNKTKHMVSLLYKTTVQPHQKNWIQLKKEVIIKLETFQRNNNIKLIGNTFERAYMSFKKPF